MSPSDREFCFDGSVIPFQPRPEKKEKLEVSTIAALVAVTILHAEGESPEDKLLQLIEQSGEAEVLDASDAFETMLDPAEEMHVAVQNAASNDNSK